MRLARGSVVLAALDPTVGHEQKGLRPCVIVSDDAVIAEVRYPLLAVVPVTGTPGQGALYPRLSPGASGLRKVSCALADQIRSIDKTRILQVLGKLSPAELAAVDAGLALFLGLPAPQAVP